MKLLNQILQEDGADTSKAITIIPDYGAYFKSVKEISEYSDVRVVIKIGKRQAEVIGEGLYVGKYFEKDLLLRGKVKAVRFE